MHYKQIVFTVLISVLSYFSVYAQASFTLERTLDGHYTPHNFEIPSGINDSFFFPSLVDCLDKNTITIELLDADYSVCESAVISLPIDNEYRLTYYTYSPIWSLPNGTRFLVIYSVNNNIKLDDYNKLFKSYVVSFTGEILYSQTAYQPLELGPIYENNGKIYIIGYMTNNYPSSPRYQTLIFSLGESTSFSEKSLVPNSYPVITVDMNGRILNRPMAGVNITKMSDGSVRKEIVK